MRRIIVLASLALVVLLLPVSAESAQLCYTKHEIAGGCTSWSAMAADLDGDGDIDVVGTGKEEGRVAWWENRSGSPCGPKPRSPGARR